RFTIETTAEVESVVLIRTDPTMTGKAAQRMKEYCYRVFELSGEYDVLSLIHASDITELNEKVDNIRETPGVTDTITLVKLNEYY
ncbi:MAG: Lrp/AsnC ligand binding domain-containing protein, partial [Thermoplasmata archaeon]